MTAPDDAPDPYYGRCDTCSDVLRSVGRVKVVSDEGTFRFRFCSDECRAAFENRDDITALPTDPNRVEDGVHVRERAGTRLVSMRETDDYDKRIDRATRFGNPYQIADDGGDYTREESIDAYRGWFRAKVASDDDFRDAVEDLRGQTLACWCTPKACHGDVILAYLDETEDT